MSTKWVVTAAAERIELGADRTGETAFTVTNPNDAADRAVVDAVAGEGADQSWFTVDDPQRPIRGGASVSYVMKVAVPADAPPGEYAVQFRVYSADSAPEESSVLSPRVMLVVPAPPDPTKRKWPWWWWLVAAGLALALLIGLGVLVFQLAGGGDSPDPAPTPGVGEVVMPDLVGMSERDALQALSAAGLTVRPIKYRHDPERPDQVIEQSPAADRVIRQDAVVDVVIAVAMTAPEVTAPEGTPVVATGEQITLGWARGDSPARRWQVTLIQEQCALVMEQNYLIFSRCQFPETGQTVVVDTTNYEPQLLFSSLAVPVGAKYHSGWVRWRVAAMDDFGTPGAASESRYFRMPVP